MAEVLKDSAAHINIYSEQCSSFQKQVSVHLMKNLFPSSSGLRKSFAYSTLFTTRDANLHNNKLWEHRATFCLSERLSESKLQLASCAAQVFGDST